MRCRPITALPRVSAREGGIDHSGQSPLCERRTRCCTGIRRQVHFGFAASGFAASGFAPLQLRISAQTIGRFVFLMMQ